MRTMFDAIYALNLPVGGDLYAGYIGGSWPDAAAIEVRFPHVTVVRIAVQASEDDGVVLDVEKGDATPAQAVDWVLRRRAAGVDPTVYCNTSTWPAVRAAFVARGVALPHWWAAAYVQDPSKPPTTLPVGAVALQWFDFGPYDASIVADYWPGVDPAPKPPAPVPAQLEEDTMIMLSVPADAAKPAGAVSPMRWLYNGTGLVALQDSQDVTGLAAAGVKTAEVSMRLIEHIAARLGVAVTAL